MEWEVSEDTKYTGNWHADAIDFANEGNCYVAVFSGPDAQKRAEEYAQWKTQLSPNATCKCP